MTREEISHVRCLFWPLTIDHWPLAVSGVKIASIPDVSTHIPCNEVTKCRQRQQGWAERGFHALVNTSSSIDLCCLIHSKCPSLSLLLPVWHFEVRVRWTYLQEPTANDCSCGSCGISACFACTNHNNRAVSTYFVLITCAACMLE